ncbi:hypothetical protein F0231_20840 [Vibrio sp. RE86]|uniref:hypothetical protein n=1 Tax=Vibrio sp. RE86 TaxID=2607605 RepID=UPI0014932A4C|nr:hypothetical protein [Vibrio sp. RE86]NOH82156.1 hypothetical protein [Vibrio sp. RE86]
MKPKLKLLTALLIALPPLSVSASDTPKVKSMVKISGTDAMFNYDIYTNLDDESGLKEIDEFRPELNARFCNVVRAWKLEMAQGRILSSSGKQVGAFSATKWDCNQ